MSWSRRFAPGVPDAVFAIVLVTVLIGGRTGFLNDPGTFWHVRLGREIARTGDVPRFDMLTYTRDRVPWVDQSWAFDLGLAALVDRWGWSGAVAVTALTLAGLYSALARGLLREGISPLVAVVVTVITAGIGSIHFLVRPHLLTFVLMLATLRICQRQHERGGWAVALIPALMVVWANVHGGFLAGPLIVLTAGFGHAVSGPWDQARRQNVIKFVATCVLALLAPLINPYGLGLYEHVGELLVSSGVTELIQEYQPIPFGKNEGRIVEWVVLALIALPTFSQRRLQRYDLAHTLVWLHLALSSVRHAPLFALAAAPGLAKLCDGLPLAARHWGRCRCGWSAWPALTALALGMAVAWGAPIGGFCPSNWPLAAVPVVNRQPVAARLFHEQDWGGLIEEECQPPRRAFLDDRFELFGKEAVLQYVDALQGGPEWDGLRDRERIELVWVRPHRGLAKRLEADPRWQVLHRDKVSVLFRRKADVQMPLRLGNAGRGNMPGSEIQGGLGRSTDFGSATRLMIHTSNGG
jgi:hypothetical protein